MANGDRTTPEDPVSDKAEARAQRRRWLSLAEIVGLAGVVIAALGLWNSYAERREGQHAATTIAAATPLVLRGRADAKGARLTISGANGEVFQSQTIVFPTPLGVADVSTHDDEGLLDAGAFDDGLKAARKAAGHGGDSKREELLPVLIETRYLANGETRSDRAIYDIAYLVDGGLFGSSVKMRGLSFNERAKASGRARVDALWRMRLPMNARVSQRAE